MVSVTEKLRKCFGAIFKRRHVIRRLGEMYSLGIFCHYSGLLNPFVACVRRRGACRLIIHGGSPL